MKIQDLQKRIYMELNTNAETGEILGATLYDTCGELESVELSASEVEDLNTFYEELKGKYSPSEQDYELASVEKENELIDYLYSEYIED